MVCINLRVFSFLEASFSILDCQRIWDSSSRSLFIDDDDCGGALATGDGASTCMPELALEVELLNEREDCERVDFPLKTFHILQKSTEQQNLWNGLGNKIVSG